jgi:predicted DNA-binding protein with PD1-like motif
MKTRLIDAASEKTYVVIFDKGDEVASGMLDVAKHYNLDAAHLTAIGAFSDVTLGYFDRERKEFKIIPVEEQVEVLALVGDIALKEDGTPQVHAHVVVGRSDGTTRGGHLLEAHVWPTLEVVVVESPAHLRRKIDPETGLARISL